MDDDFGVGDDIGSSESVGETLAKAYEEHTGEAAGDAEPLREAVDVAKTEPGGETASGDRSAQDTRSANGQAERQAEATKPAKSSESATTSWADKNPDMFARLPVEGQRYVRELERERKESASLKAEYAPVAKIFEPHKDKIKAAGTTPAALIEGWSRAETRLLDRNDRGNMVAEIMHAYGIDAQELAQSLQQMPRRLAAAQQRQQEAAVKNVSTAIDTFSTAKSQDGRPLYPHFRELENKMVELAQGGFAAGKPYAERLKELYEAALWASPKHRQAALAARDRARSTQVQPRTRGNGQTNLSLREQLEMAAGVRS